MSPKRLRDDAGAGGGGGDEGFPGGAGTEDEEAMTAARFGSELQQVHQLRLFDMVFCKLESIEEQIQLRIQKHDSAFSKLESIEEQIQLRIQKHDSAFSKLESIEDHIQIRIQKHDSAFSKLKSIEDHIQIRIEKHDSAFSRLESIEDHIQIRIPKQNSAFSELEIIQEQIQVLIRKQNSALSKLESIKEEIQAVTPREDKIKGSFHIHENHEQLAQEENNGRTSDEVAGLASGGKGESTSFRLRFLNKMNTSNIYHEDEIKSESNAAIKIGIFDGHTPIDSGRLSNAKLEILALEGNFPYDAEDHWTAKEFDEHRAHGRDGKGHVLSGEGTTAQLVNGECELGSIKFKEGSSKARKGMFIIGARVREDVGTRVQEAVTNGVVVQDRRNKLNEKSYPPKLDDRVYRLEEIARDGKYCKRLEKENIFTVKDFLRKLNKDPDNLAGILQIKKEHKTWEKMVKHASQCCLDGQHELISYNCVERDVVLFFNCVHSLVGARFSGHYAARDKFDHDQQLLVDKLKVGAYGYLDVLGLGPDHVMKDNFPVPIDTDTNTDSGAGLSYISSAIQQNFPDHLAAHQVGDITAVQGLSHAKIKPSCPNANNDPGPSSSSLDHHGIHNYSDQETQLADQEPLPSTNDWRKGPLQRLDSGDWTTEMQEVGYEDDPMTWLDNIVEPGLNHEHFIWPGKYDGNTT